MAEKAEFKTNQLFWTCLRVHERVLWSFTFIIKMLCWALRTRSLEFFKLPYYNCNNFSFTLVFVYLRMILCFYVFFMFNSGCVLNYYWFIVCIYEYFYAVFLFCVHTQSLYERDEGLEQSLFFIVNHYLCTLCFVFYFYVQVINDS